MSEKLSTKHVVDTIVNGVNKKRFEAYQSVLIDCINTQGRLKNSRDLRVVENATLLVYLLKIELKELINKC